MTTLTGIAPVAARKPHYLVTGTRGDGFVRVRRNSVQAALEVVARLRELGYRVSVIRSGAS